MVTMVQVCRLRTTMESILSYFYVLLGIKLDGQTCMANTFAYRASSQPLPLISIQNLLRKLLVTRK